MSFMAGNVLVYSEVVMLISIVVSNELLLLSIISLLSSWCKTNDFSCMEPSEFQHIKVVENTWRWWLVNEIFTIESPICTMSGNWNFILCGYLISKIIIWISGYYFIMPTGNIECFYWCISNCLSNNSK